MISRLKRKFIVTAAILTFALMTVLVLIMNIENYRGVVQESDAILDVLSRPDAPFMDGKRPPERPEEIRDFIPHGMSPEVPFESRFFVVTVSSDGSVLQSDLSRIVSVDDEAAEDYIGRALRSGSDRGSIGEFRFLRTAQEDGTKIVFLDCGRRLSSFVSFLRISVITGLSGCVAVLISLMFMAGRIVAPIAESYEKQRRFISDAGHEIRTPLTIISANVDLLELDGENEELTEIRRQAGRLAELTNDLVMLSKMEETEHALQKVEVPLSDLISETAASFRAPAVSRGIDLAVRVEPGITACASPDAVRRLVSVLLENAVKYSPEGGEITVDMEAHRKTVVLSVANATEEEVDAGSLQHVFDRFYRTDRSRNSRTGGHGIGLSIAKAVAVAHGGSIAASTKSGRDFCVTVTLPV